MQPPTPSTMPLRYMGMEDSKPGFELVATQPYFYEEELSLIDLNTEISTQQPKTTYLHEARHYFI